MIALIWLVIISAVSLLVIRIGTMALVLTGLSKDTAEFQAYSAFFGVGFTTAESELVMNHPVRRRIVRHLILMGQVGLTSVMVPLVVTFVKQDSFIRGLEQLGLIVAILAAMWLLVSSPPVRWLMDRSISWTLRRAGLPHPADYHTLLKVHEGFCVRDISIGEGHFLVGGTIARTRPGDGGVLVLGVLRKDGSYVGTPGGDVVVNPGDVLTVYGRESDVKVLAGPGGA